MVTVSVVAANGAFMPVNVKVNCEVDVIPVIRITCEVWTVQVPDVQLKVVGIVNEVGIITYI
jgi:hypothetical protein